jgi:hypothetical protein
MLKLLLDEHISPMVADGLAVATGRQVVVFCMGRPRIWDSKPLAV